MTGMIGYGYYDGAISGNLMSGDQNVFYFTGVTWYKPSGSNALPYVA